VRSEWPLVLFTLLTQAAVGSFATIGAARILMRPALTEDLASALVRAPLAGVLALLALAALSSVGHLLQPFRAWRAARNARSSWLSVEIVLFAAFALLSALVVILEWLGGPSLARDAVAAVAASAGAGLLYAMGQLYRLPSRPAWNHPLTPVSFFVTAALLGVLLVASFLAFTGFASVGDPHVFPERLAALDSTLAVLLAAGAVLLAVEVLLVQAQAAVRREASRRSALPEPRRSLLRLQRATSSRTVLALAALAMAGWFVLRRPAPSVLEPQGALVVWAALWLTVAESLIGRITFYRERPVAGV
jgi:DMSO reductase anchor subunit